MCLHLDFEHPLNRRLLTHLRSIVPAICRPADHANPYMGAGSHPDCVERLWDVLGAVLMADCRALVYGQPALVHAEKGVVLALAMGTSYALRVPESATDEVTAAGCSSLHRWGDGSGTDLAVQFGPTWIFGAWLEDECEWLARVYHELQES